MVLVMVAFLMVSRIPTFSIKTLVVRIKPDWILPTLVGVGLFVAALSSAPWHTLLAIGVIYLASLPVGWWSAYRLRRRDEAERAAADHAQASAPHIVRLGGDRSEHGGSSSEAH
jgi:CDP-diacylglycerol--serine O-phosphatidyltransferase